MAVEAVIKSSKVQPTRLSLKALAGSGWQTLPQAVSLVQAQV
jgi:hypothetical protein